MVVEAGAKVPSKYNQCEPRKSKVTDNCKKNQKGIKGKEIPVKE